MIPTATYFFDSRRPIASLDGKKGDKYPLKVLIRTSKNINRSYSIDFYFTKEEFKKLKANPQKAPFKDTWIKINAKLKKAEAVIEELMPFFSFDEFKDRFFNEKTRHFEVITDQTSINAILQSTCANYTKTEQLPMITKVTDSVRSILLFAKKENLPMRVINPKFCRDYEEYMFKKSKKGSRNGAGINLRHIRILYNNGIRKGVIPAEWYPFKRDSGRDYFEDAYTIPNERKVKVYLKEDELVIFAKKKTFNTEAQKVAHTAHTQPL